ncbi:hypothetical protein V493_06617 [Pseudogymnoascus sp. VKM F-4281 (FW-2241)]|nr:hypothetical protein V493_06617 [Pseudogymnoascus sp. VKM F-4281 (FW-2241)]
MIIRTKPSLEVCLRCQLFLSGQLRAKRPRASTPGPFRGFRARNLHATSRIAQAHEDSQKKEAEEYDAEPKRKAVSHDSATKTSSSAPDDADLIIHRYDPALPLGRMYGLNGSSQLGENTKTLGVDSLGKPAEVIVLQDSGALRYVAAQLVQSTIEAPVVDILAQFNSERGLIGRDEVNDNIETLRPQGKVLSWADIRVIEDQLSGGFTMAQLLYYIESTERQRMAALAESTASGTKDGKAAKDMAESDEPVVHAVEVNDQNIILRQSPWMPGTSDQGDGFDESSLRGYISEAFTPKQRVALNIIRLCWGIESQELVSSVGEMELQVNSTDLDLLLSPKGRSGPPLQAISDEFIQADEEKIEIFRWRRAIRITATKAKAKIIARGIRTTLEGVHRIEVPLAGLKKAGRKVKEAEEVDEFGEPVLAELAKLTNTEVVRASKDKLSVHGLGRKQGSSLSTSADAARRLLLSSSDVADRTVYKHGCKETDSPVYAVDYEYHHIASWRDRLRRWSRWQTAIGKSDSDEVCSIQERDKKELDLSKEEEDQDLASQAEHQALSMSPHHKAINLDKEKVKQYESQESNLWSTTPITSTSATVGNVLHQTPPGSGPVDVSKPVQFDEKKIMNSRTIFVPSTKNLSRLVSGMDNDGDVKTSSVLTMKFLPSPWSGEDMKQMSKFPSLEMSFSMTSTAERFILANMVAITEDVCNDIMLPDKALDIRFRQKTSFPFIAANLGSYPQITEFLEASQLGQRANVMTPPELVVPIPDFMSSLKGDKGPSSSASTAVRYLFAGLTYRTQISYEFRDWRLRYTSINSGKADGRCGELTLLPKHKKSIEPAAAKSERALNQELTMDYIKSAYALVNALESLDKPVVRRTESTESKPPQSPDSVVRYEYMPSVHYAGPNRTSVPQRFKYFDRGISFQDENDDTAWFGDSKKRRGGARELNDEREDNGNMGMAGLAMSPVLYVALSGRLACMALKIASMVIRLIALPRFGLASPQSLRGLPHQLSSPSSKTSSLFFFFFVLFFFESSAIPESSIHPGNSLN